MGEQGEARKLKFTNVHLEQGMMRFGGPMTAKKTQIKELHPNSYVYDISRRQSAPMTCPTPFAYTVPNWDTRD